MHIRICRERMYNGIFDRMYMLTNVYDRGLGLN